MDINVFYNVYIGNMIVQSMPDKFIEHVNNVKNSKGYSDRDIEITCGSVFASIIPYEDFKAKCVSTINRDLFFMGSYMCGVEAVLGNIHQHNYSEVVGEEDEIKNDILDAVRGKGSSSLSNVIKRNVISAIKKDESERDKLEKKKQEMVSKIDGGDEDESDETLDAPDETITEDDGVSVEPEKEYVGDHSDDVENGEVTEYGETTGLKRAKHADVPDNMFGIPATYSFPMNTPKRIRSAESYFYKAPEEYKPLLALNIEKAMRSHDLAVNRGTQWYDVYKKASNTDMTATYGEGVSIRQNVRMPIRSFKDLKKIPGIPKKFLTRTLHLRDEIGKHKKTLRDPNASQADRDLAMNRLSMLVSEYNVLLTDMIIPMASLGAGFLLGAPVFIGYGVGWLIGTLGDVLFGEQIEKFVDDIYDTIRGQKVKTDDPKVIKALEETENNIKLSKGVKYQENVSFMQSDDINMYSECNLLISSDVSQLCMEKGVAISGEGSNMEDNAKLIASALIVSFHIGATLGFSCDYMIDKIRSM